MLLESSGSDLRTTSHALAAGWHVAHYLKTGSSFTGCFFTTGALSDELVSDVSLYCDVSFTGMQRCRAFAKQLLGSPWQIQRSKSAFVQGETASGGAAKVLYRSLPGETTAGASEQRPSGSFMCLIRLGGGGSRALPCIETYSFHVCMKTGWTYSRDQCSMMRMLKVERIAVPH